MQRIDHYLRQAKAARDLAATASSERVRTQFENIAATWEQLARRTPIAAMAKDGRAAATARIAAAV